MYTSYDIATNYDFVLYDLKDNLICYFNNIWELISCCKKPVYKLTQLFNLSDSNYITIVIDKIKYKLYLFRKDLCI